MEILDREQVLENAIDHVFAVEEALEAAFLEESDAEHDYDIKFAKLYQTLEGSIPQRENAAKEMLEQEHKRHVHTAARLKFLREKMDNARAVLIARQSLLASERKRPV